MLRIAYCMRSFLRRTCMCSDCMHCASKLNSHLIYLYNILLLENIYIFDIFHLNCLFKSKKATDIYFLSIAKICWHRTASSLISKLFLKSCSTLVALASCSKHKSQYSWSFSLSTKWGLWLLPVLLVKICLKSIK